LEKKATQLADQLNTENRLLNELVCLINPRNPRLEDFTETPASAQAMDSLSLSSENFHKL